MQTLSDFRALPGVLEVRPVDPGVGWVTLIVTPGFEGYQDTSGNGNGNYPIGMRVRTVVRDA